VGEPLNPEAVWWGKEVLGLPIHDNWWQTETGGIMIANTPAFDIKPGSMGRPLPGIEAGHRAAHGSTTWWRRGPVDTPDVEGELALRRLAVDVPRLPEQEERYRKCFAGDLVPHRRPRESATPTATSGSSAAPTTSSSRPGT
jgi:acetyl-CoA synthetase